MGKRPGTVTSFSLKRAQGPQVDRSGGEACIVDSQARLSVTGFVRQTAGLTADKNSG